MFIEIEGKLPNSSRYETLLINTDEVYLVKPFENNDHPDAKVYLGLKQQGFIYCKSHTYQELRDLIKL